MTISSKEWVLSYAGDRNKFGDPCTQNPSKPDERLPYLDSMNQLWYWVLFSWEHHRLDGLGKATSPGYFVRCSKPESFPKLSTKNTPAVQVWSLSEAEAYLNQAKVNGTMVALTQYLQSRGTVCWNRTLVRRAIDTSPKMRSVYDVSFPAVLYFGQFNDPLTSMVHNYCGPHPWLHGVDGLTHGAAVASQLAADESVLYSAYVSKMDKCFCFGFQISIYIEYAKWWEYRVSATLQRHFGPRLPSSC